MKPSQILWGFSLFCFFTANGGVMFSTLAVFSKTNGVDPLEIIQASDGNFYGLTAQGGPPPVTGLGTVFKLTPAGALTTFFVFSDATNGSSPQGLIQCSDGNLYGCTYYGGPTNQGAPGNGTLFKLTLDGAFTTLFSFSGTNGANPTALTEGKDGNLYGTTLYGGIGYNGSSTSGTGTVFQVTKGGLLTTLAFFDEPVHGVQPFGRLVQTGNGDLFGMTRYGGTWTNLFYLGEGTIFKLATNGTLTTLVSFSGTNGSIPSSGLMQGVDGNIYGETGGGGTGYPGIYSGLAFQVTPEGDFSVLHSFTGGVDGLDPLAGMVQAQDGTLYGITGQGFTNSATLFMLTTNGILTTIHTFTGGADGQGPNSIVLGNDGNVYGTTIAGGGTGYGTIFRLTITPEQPRVQASLKLGQTVLLSWNTTPGQAYQLQYSTNLMQAAWTDMGGPITATNNCQSVSEGIGVDQQRFYRVMLLP